jgi:hypothetical protein
VFAALVISSAHVTNAQSTPAQTRPLKTNVSATRTAKSDSAIAQRNDELTLAGLRPGQDDLAKAQKFFRKPALTKFDGTNPIWLDACRHESRLHCGWCRNRIHPNEIPLDHRPRPGHRRSLFSRD